MHYKFIEIIKKNSVLLSSIEGIYVFGSLLSFNKTPNDIDILIVYSEYNNKIRYEIEKFVEQLEIEIELPVDLTILSYEEEREVGFLNRIKSLRLK